MQLSAYTLILLAVLLADPSVTISGQGSLPPSLLGIATSLVAMLALPWIRGLVSVRPRVIWRIVEWCTGVVGVVLIMTRFQWPFVVRTQLGLANTFLLDEFLLVSIAIVPLLAGWLVDAILQVRENPPLPGMLRAALRQTIQTSGMILAPLLIPLVVLWSAADLTRVFCPELGGSSWPSLGGLAAIVILFPLVLRWCWRCVPLPAGEIRLNLEDAVRQSHIPVRDILVWRTEGRLLNAAISGLIGRWRYLYLTDGLLATLSPSELRAVIRHEAAHIRHYHHAQRLLLLAIPIWLGFCLTWQLPTEAGAEMATAAGSRHGLLLAAGMGIYCVIALGIVSRLLEYHADLSSCQLQRSQNCPQATRDLISALTRLRQCGCHADPSCRFQFSWLHPPLDARIRFLQESLNDPATGIRFADRLRRFRHAALAAAIAAPLAGSVAWLVR